MEVRSSKCQYPLRTLACIFFFTMGSVFASGEGKSIAIFSCHNLRDCTVQTSTCITKMPLKIGKVVGVASGTQVCSIICKFRCRSLLSCIFVRFDNKQIA